MANLPFDQRFSFDTELTIAASTFTGTAQLVGSLTNEPVIIMFKNQTSVAVFLADNGGATAGTTMAVGESFILDCRANKGAAPNGGFPISTPFYVTASVGTGNFKISIIYAK